MTHLLDGDTVVSLAQGLISEKKQKGRASLDLTVRRISRVDSGGALDFGGSEFQEVSEAVLTPEKKTPEEPYGWWKLGPGRYLMRFNESISLPHPGIILIVPHDRLIAAGASHAPVILDGFDADTKVLLSVGSQGLAVKENARVSKAVVMYLPHQ